MVIHFQRKRTPPGLVILACLVALAVPLRASTEADRAAAVRLVQAQLPKNIDLIRADSETLAGAVGRATLDHRAQAPAILWAALTGGVSDKGAKNQPVPKRSGGAVVKLFKAALRAAPEQASALTDVAVALYPDDADQLSAVVILPDQRVAYDYKDRPDYKDRTDYKDRADYKDRTGAPVAGISNFADPLGFSGGDIGFSPGFPGSPGFVGSPPSGSVALPEPLPVVLPPPSGTVVTPVTNE